jgi:hypothetical protein
VRERVACVRLWLLVCCVLCCNIRSVIFSSIDDEEKDVPLMPISICNGMDRQTDRQTGQTLGLYCYPRTHALGWSVLAACGWWWWCCCCCNIHDRWTDRWYYYFRTFQWGRSFYKSPSPPLPPPLFYGFCNNGRMGAVGVYLHLFVMELWHLFSNP